MYLKTYNYTIAMAVHCESGLHVRLRFINYYLPDYV